MRVSLGEWIGNKDLCSKSRFCYGDRKGRAFFVNVGAAKEKNLQLYTKNASVVYVVT